MVRTLSNSAKRQFTEMFLRGSERTRTASIHNGENSAIQTERHSQRIKVTMLSTLRSHDDVPPCSDTSMRGLLRDMRSDVREVLRDAKEGKVEEGRKEGEWESFGGVRYIYIITQRRLRKRISNGKNIVEVG